MKRTVHKISSREPNVHRVIVAGALGECVHVAGVLSFLRLAEGAGWQTVFLGPAVSVAQFIAAIREYKPAMVGVSYRLTPENGEKLVAQFAEEADEFRTAGMRFLFGGTAPVARRVKELGFFERVFDGTESIEECQAFLQGQSASRASLAEPPQTVLERMRWKAPAPLLRHHFGLPDLEATKKGIRQIAEAGVLDVVSLGIDQDAQENFFHPERQDPRRRGAGGVPVRTADQYRELFAASRTGNFPLMRTYAGSDDFLALAEMYQDTIHNAWCAVPLFWFNRMDGRGPWDLEGSIRQHQQLMKWHAERSIPVELNEPHHWGLRFAPDAIFVVAAYLSAYNAKAFGVRDYIAQFMFNCPPTVSDEMDLAKMHAILDLILPLEGKDFFIWKQTRTGLLSYPIDLAAARAHLAATIYLQMNLKPHIVHVVSHVEADHAAAAGDVIEACRMASHVIRWAIKGQPSAAASPRIQRRKKHLAREALVTLEAIRSLGTAEDVDPLTDPGTLARAVELGILDAPHLRDNAIARGTIRTAIIDGACEAVNEKNEPLKEEERIGRILKERRK
jgi:methylmalonyl-CoA mutase cobalamin-binding subunit